MTAPPAAPVITRESFAALVADLRTELAAMSRPEAEAIRNYVRRPASFTGYPWADLSILLTEAALLTGYSRATLAEFAGRPGMEYARFPPTITTARKASRRYAAGDVAVWMASRDPSGHHRFGVRDRPPKLPLNGGLIGYRGRYDQRVTFLARLITGDPALSFAAALETCERGGVGVPVHNKGRWVDRGRARALPEILARFAPGRPDGLVSIGDVADVFRMSPHRVAHAAERGVIRAVRDGGRYWIDPARLRFRSELSRSRARRYSPTRFPTMLTDKDDPRAVPLPGDEQEDTT